MKRTDIIKELKQYFSIKELVCKHVYNKFGEKSWQFLSTDILHVLLVLRKDILKAPLVVNNWAAGGSVTQRGLRCNICQLVADKTKANTVYVSAHSLGRGFDMQSSKMTAAKMRELIEQNADKLPCNVRIERDVTWLHIDTYDNDATSKITYFNG